MYTGGQQRQSRMDEADRLPYTLDYLVVEELDHIQTPLNTSMFKHQLDVQVAPESMTNGSPHPKFLHLPLQHNHKRKRRFYVVWET